ncbi:geranylgeranyl transferase type-2 subunit alpha-like [Liolophura sinensis]|uniref:geranylgeranyl transferase type-2 subunit alpha-like n=1 Tax=Liolophura sinensis TaxID=3198878 RepID=UPI00315867EB
MHGRLKVKTTAEQAEAKRLEREKKLKIYNAAMQKVMEKRKNGEYDSEALHITGEILSANPDVYSLWNFRKEIFEAWKEQKSEEELNKVFQDELYFVETCLRANPKSYGSWQQRCYILTTMPRPNWTRELGLCNKFLEYDERNFHCWDYRRFVVNHAEISPEEELEFSTSKISSNFSNYSSWHYRSKLLPLVKPDPSQPVGITEEALLNEFEIVQNAFFTDPDDQSAWFYHRWLLGRGQTKLDVHSVLVCKAMSTVTVGFTTPILIGKDYAVGVTVNGSRVNDGSWTVPGGKHKYSSVWILSAGERIPDADLKVDVTVTQCGEPKPCVQTSVHMPSGSGPVSWQRLTTTGITFSHEISATASVFLTKELESCHELHELEPENKWALLTIVLLMKSLDPEKYEEAISNNLIQLETLDSKRQNYYRDLRSKFLLENAIERLDWTTNQLELPERGLTTVTHLDHLMSLRRLKLAKNRLKSLKGFSHLQGVEELDLSENQIQDLTGLEHLPLLHTLSLVNNNVQSIEDLNVLRSNPALKILHLTGNPCVKTENFQKKASEVFPRVKINI